MKKTNEKRSLRLSAETVRSLARTALDGVGGGSKHYYSVLIGATCLNGTHTCQ